MTEKLNLLSRLDNVATRIAINALDKADSPGLQRAYTVAEIMYALGRRLDRPTSSPDQMWLAGFLHNIGTIGIPKAITEKKGRFTSKERMYMHQHPTLSAFIIDRMFSTPDLSRAALHHHERFDGKGYPHGLAGKDIPFASRLIADADAYDAMRSRHWFLSRLSHDGAMAEIGRESGTQFDPDIVKLAQTYEEVILIAYKHSRSVTAQHILDRI